MWQDSDKLHGGGQEPFNDFAYKNVIFPMINIEIKLD